MQSKNPGNNAALRAALLEQELGEMNAAGARLTTEILKLRGQVELLSRALEKYGFHSIECARRQLHVCEEGEIPSAVLADCECTCGLDKIVTPDPVVAEEPVKSSSIILGA